MKVIILTTASCVKCKGYIKDIRETMDLDYPIEILDAIENPDARDLVNKYNVRSVPFTIITNDEGGILYASNSITHACELSKKLNDLLG